MPFEIFLLDRLPTPLGEMLVVTDASSRVRASDWADYEPRMLRLLGLRYGVAGFALEPGEAPDARAAFEAYFAGEFAAIDRLSVETGGTRFQREVWAALREIPAGHTLSYGALAGSIGRPAAVRAVGLANGANPVGIIVPCHRVIGSDRSLTGYGGGLHRKRWLLEHEGVRLPKMKSLKGEDDERFVGAA
jgi:methylated-DNA-[protein]-cysteine S-methyltransferase